MEENSQEMDRKTVLINKIKMLENERDRLKSEIIRIREVLTTSELESKAKNLENEVTQLKTLKVKLEEKLPNKNGLSNESKVSQTLEQNKVHEMKSGNPPVKYGTWSKITVS